MRRTAAPSAAAAAGVMEVTLTRLATDQSNGQGDQTNPNQAPLGKRGSAAGAAAYFTLTGRFFATCFTWNMSIFE